MEPIVIILTVFSSAVIGAWIATIYLGPREQSVVKPEDESILAFVETFKEILTLQADKVEADFIKRITAKAEQISASKNGVQHPDDRSHTYNNSNHETP